MSVTIDSAFNPVPSLTTQAKVTVTAGAPSSGGSEAATPGASSAIGILVPGEGELPGQVQELGGSGLTRDALKSAGFEGKPGQTYLVPGTPLAVLIGTGEGLDAVAKVRDTAAAFARAAKDAAHLTLDLGDLLGAAPSGEGASAAGATLSAQDAALAATEGVLLARYRYDALKTDPKTTALESLTLIVAEAELGEAQQGAERGATLARSANIARDLANTPPRHLSAVKLAAVIGQLAPEFGLEAEVFDEAALQQLGTGGLLGVNAGSIEPARMIKVSYRPSNATGHLALVGKGIMYDSGGISLKPSNAMHALMKFDMLGAASVFASMTALRDLGATTAVTGWLMCTDNMPSGSATKLGDVLTIRGGTTVEVKNTDAEGRLVLADGLVLATEDRSIADQAPDAIVDIATLTGAALMALGDRTAMVIANNDAVAEGLLGAADVTDENLWRFPLDHRYRDQLKSQVADISNMGGQYGGSILAALFLNDFVGEVPWGHLDIAGTMMSDKDDSWRSAGSTGFGARLLATYAHAFVPPVSDAKSSGR